MIYQHKGMLLQNLHHRYLYILIKLPHLLDLEQQIPENVQITHDRLITLENRKAMMAKAIIPLLKDLKQ